MALTQKFLGHGSEWHQHHPVNVALVVLYHLASLQFDCQEEARILTGKQSPLHRPVRSQMVHAQYHLRACCPFLQPLLSLLSSSYFPSDLVSYLFLRLFFFHEDLDLIPVLSIYQIICHTPLS